MGRRLLLLLALLAPAVGGSSRAQAADAVPPALAAFLDKYLELPTLAERDPQWPSYVAAPADLHLGRGGQVLVYATDRRWCGSGGCALFILTPEDDSYRVVSKVTISRPPIRVLDHVTNGWHDISVGVSGGGADARDAVLAFTGTRYPGNPSLANVPTLPKGARGTVVIDVTDDHRPYAPAAGAPTLPR